MNLRDANSLTRLIIAVGALVLFAGCMTPETLSGSVTDASGVPLANLDLDVFDALDKAVAITGGVTDATGAYTLTLPGAGTYKIRADARLADGLVDLFFDQTFLRSAAQLITVAADQAVTGIDFALPSGVQIRGRVISSESGTGEPGIDMDVIAANGEFLSGFPATTAADGTFVFGALPPGDYFVVADPDPAQSQLFVRTFFGGATRMANATAVTVGATDVSGIDITLPAGGMISGRVADASSGVGITGLDLDLFDASGNRAGPNALTDGNGAYTIGPVAVGNYTLRVDPTVAQGYPRTYFPSAFRLSDAQPISVQAFSQNPGIDFALLRGGSISGRVTDANDPSNAGLSGLDFDLFEAQGTRLEITAKTDTNGDYLIGLAAPGDYILRVDPTMVQGFPRTYYPDALALSGGQVITVQSELTTPGIDFALTAGGSIQGMVSDANSGAALADIDLDIFDVAGARVDITTRTDANGMYTIGLFPPGDYLLRVDPTIAQGYPLTYFPDSPRKSTATPVRVDAAMQTSGIDLTLSLGGTVSGTIIEAGMNMALEGIDLDCFDATGSRIDATARSDVNGQYQLGPLAPGDYFVKADPADLSGLAEQVFAGRSDVNIGDLLTVTVGGDTAGTDFALVRSGGLSGTITDTGSQPLAGIDLDLYQALLGTRLRTSAVTLADGTFLFPNLTPGDYLLRADPSSAQAFADAYFDAKITRAASDILTVVADMTTSNVTFALEQSATISGIVSDGSGAVLSGFDMDIFEAVSFARLDQTVVTDATGAYTLSNIPPGVYIVRVDPAAGQGFVRTYFGDTVDRTLAAPIAVVTGQMVTGIDITAL